MIIQDAIHIVNVLESEIAHKNLDLITALVTRNDGCEGRLVEAVEPFSALTVTTRDGAGACLGW